MRYYIRRNDKIASISISEELSQYLIIKLGGSTSELGAQVPRKNSRNGKTSGIRLTSGKGLAQHWINELVESSSDIPEKNVSQWVQAKILHFIVDPDLRKKLDQIAEGFHPHSGHKLKSYSSK